jgi:hypothetical protein
MSHVKQRKLASARPAPRRATLQQTAAALPRVPATTAQECTFGGAAGGAAQGVLLLFVIASLVAKRARETPRRSLLVWSLDVAKQFLAVAGAHVSGLVWSHVLSGDDASECAYYFVVFTLDTTAGVAASLALHRAMCAAAARVAAREEPAPSSSVQRLGRRLAAALARTGEYGSPPSARIWAAQAAAWVLCVLVGAPRRAYRRAVRVLADLASVPAPQRARRAGCACCCCARSCAACRAPWMRCSAARLVPSLRSSWSSVRCA